MSILKKLSFLPQPKPVEWSDVPQARTPNYRYDPGPKGLLQRLAPSSDQKEMNRAAVNAMRRGDPDALRAFLVRADPQRVLNKAFDTRPKRVLSPDMQQIAVGMALEHGADPTLPDEKTGESVLHKAARQGRLDVAKEMVEHVSSKGSLRGGAMAAGNFVLNSNRAGESPLAIAAQLKTEEGAKLHDLLQETVEIAANKGAKPPAYRFDATHPAPSSGGKKNEPPPPYD